MSASDELARVLAPGQQSTPTGQPPRLTLIRATAAEDQGATTSGQVGIWLAGMTVSDDPVYADVLASAGVSSGDVVEVLTVGGRLLVIGTVG